LQSVSSEEKSGVDMGRREFGVVALMAMIGLPLTANWLRHRSAGSDDPIILHGNWILKSSDLDL
jgi:hypothetical protein